MDGQARGFLEMCDPLSVLSQECIDRLREIGPPPEYNKEYIQEILDSYKSGLDPEYSRFRDADGDGLACE